MALKVYFSDDIGGVIEAGVVFSVRTAYAHKEVSEVYLIGALAAFQHQAIAFHCDWGDILQRAQSELGGDLFALLERVRVGGVWRLSSG